MNTTLTCDEGVELDQIFLETREDLLQRCNFLLVRNKFVVQPQLSLTQHRQLSLHRVDSLNLRLLLLQGREIMRTGIINNYYL